MFLRSLPEAPSGGSAPGVPHRSFATAIYRDVVATKRRGYRTGGSAPGVPHRGFRTGRSAPRPKRCFCDLNVTQKHPKRSSNEISAIKMSFRSIPKGPPTMFLRLKLSFRSIPKVPPTMFLRLKCHLEASQKFLQRCFCDLNVAQKHPKRSSNDVSAT
jgi:hypothetical protein